MTSCCHSRAPSCRGHAALGGCSLLPPAPHVSPLECRAWPGLCLLLQARTDASRTDLTCPGPPSPALWRLFLPHGPSCPQWAAGRLLRSGLSGTSVGRPLPPSCVSKPRLDASLHEGLYTLEGTALAASPEVQVVCSDICALVLRADAPGACVPCS